MTFSIAILLFYSCPQECLQVVGNQFDLPFSVCLVYTWLYFIHAKNQNWLSYISQMLNWRILAIGTIRESVF
jgi:hypothetical protein